MCVNKLKGKCDELSILQADYFENIRREIDIKRETLTHDIMNKNGNEDEKHREMLARISQQSIQMISQVEMHEEAFRRNFIQTLNPN